MVGAGFVSLRAAARDPPKWRQLFNETFWSRATVTVAIRALVGLVVAGALRSRTGFGGIHVIGLLSWVESRRMWRLSRRLNQ